MPFRYLYSIVTYLWTRQRPTLKLAKVSEIFEGFRANGSSLFYPIYIISDIFLSVKRYIYAFLHLKSHYIKKIKSPNVTISVVTLRDFINVSVL